MRRYEDIDAPRGIEFGLWHNGRLMTQVFYTAITVRDGYEHMVNLPSNESANAAYQVRLRFGGEIVDDWVGAEMWLYDINHNPISAGKPALIYLGHSDLPMTTVFLSNYPRPLSHSGVWVVTTRRMTDIPKLAPPPAD